MKKCVKAVRNDSFFYSFVCRFIIKNDCTIAKRFVKSF